MSDPRDERAVESISVSIRARRDGPFAGLGASSMGLRSVELVTAERMRQVQEEGYDAGHDDVIGAEALVEAGVAYAIAARAPTVIPVSLVGWWPWDPKMWKATGDRVRDLVKACALLMAAIDVEVRKQERREQQP